MEKEEKKKKEITVRIITKTRERRLNTMDIDALSKQIRDLEKKCVNLESDINYEAKNTIDTWKYEAIDNGLRILNDFFNEASGKVEGAKGEETTSWTTGILFWKETHYDTYTTVNTNQIINSINLYKNKFNEQMYITLGNMYIEFRELIISKIYNVFADNGLEVRESDISRSVSAIINEYLDKKVTYTDNMPLAPNGKLSHSSAEKFIAEADRYLQKMREDFRTVFDDENISSLANKLKSIDFGKETLEKQKSELETKKDEVQNKKRAEEKWIIIKSEIVKLF